MQIISSRLIYSGIVLLLLLLTTGLSSGDEVNVDFVSHIGGQIRNVAVDGNYAYIGQGQDLVVLDVTDVANTSEVGKVNIPSTVYSVAVQDNYAYVISKDGVLFMVDMSNLAFPVIKGSYDSGMAFDVAVASNYAYVADRDGILILDISDPSEPALSGSYGINIGFNTDIVVSGNYAYVADDGNALVIVDITNPSAPSLVGSYDTDGCANAVAVAGNYAYVADETNGLMILDITNPYSPILISNYDSAAPVNDVTVAGNYAYIGNTTGLVIIDISNPSSPTLEGTCNVPGWGLDVVIEDDYAFVATGSLVIVDITNPSSPSLAGGYDTASYKAYGVAVVENYAYVADSNSLLIVDITNPSVPTLIKSFDIPDWAYDVVISGNFAYVVGNGFVVVNITNPFSPSIVGSYHSDQTFHVAISGNYAYVANGSSGLEIVDVTDLSAPTLVSTYDTVGNAYDVTVLGNYAYIADTVDGLLILDVTDPSSPTLAGIYDTAGITLEIAVEGNYAYVTNNLGDEEPDILEIIDISVPSAPTLAGIYSEYNIEGDIAVSGKYAYKAVMGNGLIILNITNPSLPTLAGSYDTADRAHGVAVSDNYVYVADSSNGLVILYVETESSTASYVPAYDNRLRQSTPNSVLSSSNYIDIGRIGTTSYRDVMWFDLSGYISSDTISKDTISKATLSLCWYYPPTARRTSDTVVEVYRPDQWNPQYVTWNSRMSGTPWSTAGGSWYDKNGVVRGSTPYASLTFAGTKIPDHRYYEFDVTQLVQEYVSDTANTGFFLKAKTEGNNYIAFYSSEWPNTEQRPKLTITTTSVSVDNPPVAEAGPDQVAATDAVVTFNGSTSTDDKGIITYSWDFDAEDGITTDATGVTATTSYTAAGNYTVTLTVTDTVGQTDSDTLQVVVSSPTTTITLTPDYDNRLRQSSPNTVYSSSNYIDIGRLGTTSYRDVMLFDLSGYNSNDTISKATLSLCWYYPPGATRTSDTVVEVYRPEQWDPQYVTWNSRMSGTPWAIAGGNWFDKNGVAQGTTPYASVTFPAGTVPDNKYYEFDVTQLVQEYVSGTANTGFFLKAKTEGNNYIAFYSSDWPNADQGPKLTITTTSGTTPVDNLPIAEAGPDRVAATGAAVTFNGSASTDDKGITTYSWDFDAEDGITTDATGVTATTTYTAVGNYTVTLTVTDTVGQTDSDTLQAVVSSPTTTVTYTPDYDNRLRQSSPNTVLSNYNYIDIGRIGTTSYRDVMWFDLSGYNPTDTISKATLSLYWYYPLGATRTSDTVVEVYRPEQWDPSYVTWNSRMSGTPWTAAGGYWYDKNGVAQGTTPYASVSFLAGTVPDNKYYEFDVTQLVQEYVSGTVNTGFFLKAKTEGNNYIAFYSSDWPNAGQRPKLNVTSS